MDDSISIGIAVAFSAGLLSFLSPCVLPLIPSYVTFVAGVTLDDAARARRAVLLHSALFVLGFSSVFIVLGAGATVLGRVLLAYRLWLARAGGALIVIFGLYLLGVLNVSAFSRERRVHLADKPVGYLGSVLVGVAFGAGWTPCIGPILGAILTYNLSSPSPGRGVALLGAYSAGLAIPFLLAALALGPFVALLGRWRRYLVWSNRVAGGLLVIVGLLLMSSWFTRMAGWLSGLTPAVLRGRL